MRGKLLFAAGLAAGYVIGARAGRPAYEAIAERVRSTAADPKLHQVVTKAKEALEEKAPQVADVAGKVADTTAGAAKAAKDATPADDAAADEGGDAGSPPKPGPSASTGSSTRGTASTGTPAA